MKKMKKNEKDEKDEKDEKRNSTILPDTLHMFNKQLIEYTVPESIPYYESNYETLIKNKIIDFSSKSNNIIMTDYELAFSTQSKNNITIVPKTLDDIIKERDNFILSL